MLPFLSSCYLESRWYQPISSLLVLQQSYLRTSLLYSSPSGGGSRKIFKGYAVFCASSYSSFTQFKQVTLVSGFSKGHCLLAITVKNRMKIFTILIYSQLTSLWSFRSLLYGNVKWLNVLRMKTLQDTQIMIFRYSFILEHKRTTKYRYDFLKIRSNIKKKEIYKKTMLST